MGGTPNKKKLVVLVKVAPPQAMTLCLTVRDVYGFAVPDLKLGLVDAKGTKLRALGGGDLVTDKDGRVDVANVDGPAADPDALPKWVWYLMFHITGLRYSPPGRENGAHFSYFYPSQLLQQLRFDEIDARWPGRDPKVGFSKDPPDPRDVTEAFVLAESRKDRDSYKAGLCDSDPKKVNATLVTFFRKLAGEAETAQKKREDSTRVLNGDQFALGLLKAKHLKKNFPDKHLKTLVSHTALRNDVSAAGWEITGEGMEGFTSSPTVKTILVNEFWKTRHKETRDILMNSAVCNQTAEIAEHVRGNSITGGIPRNADAAASHGPLLHFTLANAPRIHRGMHIFFTTLGAPSARDQAVPNDLVAVDEGWWLPVDDKSTTEADILPVGSIPELSATFADFVDSSDPVNRLIAQNKKKSGNVVRDGKEFTGFRRVSQASFFPGNHDGSLRGNCFVRCRKDRVQDAEPDPQAPTQVIGKLDDKGKPLRVEVDTLELFKWFHQEFVVDVRKVAGGFEIFTLSTSADVAPVPSAAGHENGTGIRKHILNNTTPRQAHMLVGAAFSGEHPDEDLLHRVYLNADLLLKK